MIKLGETIINIAGNVSLEAKNENIGINKEVLSN